MSGARQRNLWLVRHAPVAAPHGVIHGPDAPADLTDVRRIARVRASLPVAPAWCSPSRRTVETAAALSIDATQMEAFREQTFGTWTGRRHAELANELGQAYHDFWLRPDVNRAPGGESFVDQMRRVDRGLRALPAGDHVLVVHSGTIRAILALALGRRSGLALQFVADPLSVTRVDQIGTQWRIEWINRV